MVQTFLIEQFVMFYSRFRIALRLCRPDLSVDSWSHCSSDSHSCFVASMPVLLQYDSLRNSHDEED